MRGPDREPGLGGNKIHDPFCLGEIKFPVEKCALGKLAGRGVHGAAFEEAGQNLARDEYPTMARKFHGIFPSEGIWAEEDGEKAIVDYGPGYVTNLAASRQAWHRR
jgi:hypothetical protein